MDHRHRPPAAFWGESLSFWSRLWQIQIEQSLRFWGAMAAHAPRPSSKELAEKADAARPRRAGHGRKPAARTAGMARKAAPRPPARAVPAAQNSASPPV